MEPRRHRPARSRVPRRLRPLLHPAVLRHWLVVVALAILLGAVVGRTVSGAVHARDAWGRTRPVLVARTAIQPGQGVRASDVRTVRWPVGLVPEGAVAALAPHAHARGALAPGSPLTATALVDDALRRDGARTLAVPTDAHALRVEVGDVVDLWSVPDDDGLDAAPAARRVATGAEVIAVGADAVEVAIDPEQVAATASATATTHVVLVGRR